MKEKSDFDLDISRATATRSNQSYSYIMNQVRRIAQEQEDKSYNNGACN